MARASMASRDDDDIDLELRNRVGELNQYVEELRRKMTELDRKKEQLEDVKKRLNEISIECHQSDDSGKKEKDGLWKRLEELMDEFYNIKDSCTSGFDLGVGSGNSGGAGSAQDVSASMSKSAGQAQEGCKTDDVKTGGTEGNQSRESRSGHVEGKGKDEFHGEATDSGDDLFEVPVYTLAEGVSTVSEMEKLEHDEEKSKDVSDLGSDCTETKGGSQELKKESDVKKRFVDKIAESDSSDDLEHPIGTDTEDILTNIAGLDQELKNIIQRMERDHHMKKTKSDSSDDRS